METTEEQLKKLELEREKAINLLDQNDYKYKQDKDKL